MTPIEILNKFFYRKCPFAVKTSKGFYVPVYRNVTVVDIEKHLRGGHTIGAYQSREDETCTWACIDFDDHKYKSTIDSMELLLSAAIKMDDNIIKDYLVEKSESKGYHLWIFFYDPEETPHIYNILLQLLKGYSLYPGRDSKIDIFPRSPHLSGKKVGWLVRIPR